MRTLYAYISYFFLVYNQKIKEHLFLAPHLHPSFNFSTFHTFSNLRSVLSPDLWVGGMLWLKYYHSYLLPDGLAQGFDYSKRNKISLSCIRRGATVLFAQRQKDERRSVTKQTSPPKSCLQVGEHPHSAAH